MQENIANFWKWFSEKQEELLTMDELSKELQEQLLDNFQDNLDECVEGLSFEISPLSESGREIVFSADGERSLIGWVEQLVEQSPILDWWEFTAFRQPIGNDISVNFNNEKYETAKMYFLPLASEEFPDSLGLRIALPNYRPDDGEQELGVFFTLEAQIGELDMTQHIDYIELCKIPENTEEEGFIPLVDFPEYLIWFLESD